MKWGKGMKRRFSALAGFLILSFLPSCSPEQPVLREVSFTARQGQVTALVGPSGGGKSTSAKLAAQIPGSVLVDSLEAAADWVKQNAREGDLVITLGCGDIYKASKMMVADNNK